MIDRITQRGSVVIGYRDASVPFSYLDAEGKPVGYAIDLCGKISEALRKTLALTRLKVEYVKVTSTTRIEAVAQGQVDLECESTTNNSERRKTVAFSVPHYITGARYLVRADSTIRELKDFRGKTLASTVGTTPLKAVEQANNEHRHGIRVINVPDHVRGVEMVERGDADGFVMDEVLLMGLKASRPDPSKVMIVGKYLTIETLGIMLPKNDAEFKQIVDAEMKRLILSREATAVHDRWFTRPIPPKGRSLELPMNHLHKDFWKYPSDWVPG
ncbi:amino acid ABC transporter substrate-binding protein [Hydrogenophaga sp. A37]|uniref:amino acid ABC transporter substrate-binding protein n=1 Tax=Hydrogenophaga sp. A37 TaxID=1945864 RepID=UPI00209B890E|nr:amino acid ABC transporter substrate-binding protein [Hydrogenophaga sp. A37]